MLTMNTTRLSREELHRRHLPVLMHFAPLVELEKEGAFRSDLPVSWLLAVIRAIVHTASSEMQSGRIPESKAEAAMLSTVLSVILEPE